jgi:hypothetical protein
MNARFEQLMQNKPVPIGSIGNWGRVEWAYNVYPQLGDQLYAGVDLQKFAEAIVKECLHVVNSNKSSGPKSMWNQALLVTNDQIRDHFGVENA